MLDTDISSYVIRRRPPVIAERFERHAEQLCVSVMTAAELRFGAVKAGRADLARLVEAYLARVTILDWPESATFHYARIRAKLESRGTPIGNMDLLRGDAGDTIKGLLMTSQETAKAFLAANR